MRQLKSESFMVTARLKRTGEFISILRLIYGSETLVMYKDNYGDTNLCVYNDIEVLDEARMLQKIKLERAG